MTKSIYDHISFFTLSEEDKAHVLTFAKKPPQQPNDFVDIFNHQAELSLSLTYWDEQVNKISQLISSRDGMALISENVRGAEILKHELSFALYIFNARYQLSFKQYQVDQVADHAEQFKKCFAILDALNKAAGLGNQDSRPPLPVLQDDGINNGVKKASIGNERRLYWVWAGRWGVLGSVIGLFPDDYYNKTQALSVLDVPVPLMGALSWALYYVRGSVKLGLAIRTAMSGPNDIEFQKRLSAQLDYYKFDLLNDYVWATGNLACFFWLYGSKDYSGGVVTIFLLLMDASLAVWGYMEQRNQYDKDMVRLDGFIAALTDPQEHKKLNYIRRQCKLEWDYKLYGLIADILYAVTLMLSFSMLYPFLVPTAVIALATSWSMGLITVASMGFTGTALCFSLNAFFAAARQVIDICKSVELANYAVQDHDGSNETFDIELHAGEHHYHEKIIEFKKANLARSVVVDLMVPPLVFCALVYMPLGVGVSVVSLGFLLAVTAYYYVDYAWEHDIKCLPAYCAGEDAKPKVSFAKTQGFFGKLADSFESHRAAHANALA